jgi:hypothetical protein
MRDSHCALEIMNGLISTPFSNSMG